MGMAALKCFSRDYQGLSLAQAIVTVDKALRLGPEGKIIAGRIISEQKELLSDRQYLMFICGDLELTPRKAEKLMQAWRNTRPAGMYLKNIKTSALGFLCQPNMDEETALEICQFAKKGKTINLEAAQLIFEKNHPKAPASALEVRRIVRAIIKLAKRLPKAELKKLIKKLQKL